MLARPLLSCRYRTARLSAVAFAGFALVLMISLPAHAQTSYWTLPPGQSGDWSVAANWGGTLPTSGRSALIASGGTTTITLPGEICDLLQLDATVQMTGGGLDMGAAGEVGYSGTGTFIQSGGINASTLSIPVALYLGTNAGDSGTYNLSGTGLLATEIEYVGYLGTGAFTQSGGTNTCSGYLILGARTGSSGTYNLSGTGLLSVPYMENVGDAGPGTFTQSGGTNSIGNGGLVLSGTPGVTGTYNLNAGLLVLPVLSGGTGISVFNFNGGTLQASGSFSTSVPMTLGASGVGATFDTAGFAVTLAAALSGSGNLTKADSGALILAASNTYTGTTTINAGTLSLANAAALAGGGKITFGGGTLQYTNSNSIDYSANIIGSAGPVLIDTNGVNVMFASNLVASNTGGFTKIGNGTLTLAAANGYTGTTTVNGGVLSLANSAALPVSGSITFGGGTLQYTGSNGNDYSAAIVNSTGPISIDTNGVNVTFASSLVGSNTGGLTKIGSGSLTLAAAGTFGGNTLVSGGTLALGSSLALQNSTLDTSGSGTLSFGSLNSATFGGLAGSGMLALSNASSSAVALSAGNNNASTIFSGGLSGGGSLTKVGSGTLVLSGSNTYTGGTTIAAGTLQVGNGGSGASIAGTGSLLDNGALVFNHNDAMTFTPAISGVGSLTQTGSGILTLLGSNSYTGSTTISAGTLQVGNGGSGACNWQHQQRAE